jgi:hypothetical protein
MDAFIKGISTDGIPNLVGRGRRKVISWIVSDGDIVAQYV